MQVAEAGPHRVMLKKRMRESLVIMAQRLEGVPADEQIALAVTIPYWPWEEVERNAASDSDPGSEVRSRAERA